MSSHPFDIIEIPAIPLRPRQTAITAVLDKGLGPGEVRSILDAAAEWIDVVKLGWASARLTGAAALRAKIAAYREVGIRVCTGGTFLEVALAQDRVAEFLKAARALDIDMIEVSNGVHPMEEVDKCGLIGQAREAGFVVWSEVGKKDSGEDAQLSIEDRIASAERELNAGAEKIVLEGRESGTVGIYDKRGQPSGELIERVAGEFGLERLVFEAPIKAQQVWMIRHFGSAVNLGNVAPSEAIPLATLRTGLRGDTFADFHLRGTDVYVGMGVGGAMEARERGGVVIMIDALRASATILSALAAGMSSVKVVATAAECVGEVTAGERGGRKLSHCDHGNSPTELLREDYSGKQLVLTTTNGAEVLLTAAGPETTILIGTTINARAAADAAVAHARRHRCPITLLEAGRNNRRAAEDALAAGEIFRAMKGVHLHGPPLPISKALESDFFRSDSGRNLAKLGYSEDVSFCARCSAYDLVGVYDGSVIVPLAESEET